METETKKHLKHFYLFLNLHYKKFLVVIEEYI